MKNVLVKLKGVPAGKAMMGGSFNTILGQSGINIKLFCDEFNLKSKDFYLGLPVIIRLESKHQFNVNKLNFLFIGVAIHDLIFFYRKRRGDIWYLSLKDTYLIYLIMKKIYLFNNVDFLWSGISFCKTVIATAKSMDIVLDK